MRIKLNYSYHTYTGEVDQDNKLCGYGTASKEDCSYARYEGTFFNNDNHGISNYLFLSHFIFYILVVFINDRNGTRSETEIKYVRQFGKATSYEEE